MMEEELQRMCPAERHLLGVLVMVVGRYTRVTGRHGEENGRRGAQGQAPHQQDRDPTLPLPTLL